jgi:hypothetical protein
MRAILLAITLLLCSCSASHAAPGPATAKGVVLQAKDLAGIQKCPQSDRWAELMLNGQPEMLPSGFATWSDLKVAGATEGWLSLYADIESECPLVLGSAPPKGRLVYTTAIKFKDLASAASSFVADSKAFPVADYFADRFAAAGGTVTRGASTGFGENSTVATISARGVATYVAFWQNKNFDAVIYADNLTESEANSAATRMNARIH